jgi:hypothetical protein
MQERPTILGPKWQRLQAEPMMPGIYKVQADRFAGFVGELVESNAIFASLRSEDGSRTVTVERSTVALLVSF